MRLVAMLWIPLALQAAVIRGTVVENQTTHPLARATVVVQPLSGTPGMPVSVRTNSYGGFEVANLAAGSYLVKASRRGFLAMEYGQKQWNSAGLPITLKAEEAATITFRLPRFGAISGTILDENDVGLPDFPVIVYRQTQPPELVANTRTDERGIYRMSGLLPGTYLVRSGAKQDEDGEYLPTFSKETQRRENAGTAQVFLEEETRGVDVRAIPGKLFSLSGVAMPAPPGTPVTVTLVSDLGRQAVGGPAFHFEGLPPGPYQLYAQTPDDPEARYPFQAAYLPLALEKDTSVRVPMLQVRETRFELDGLPPSLAVSAQILARRKDLAGTGEMQRLLPRPTRLAPGPWEFSLVPPPNWYISGFTAFPVTPVVNERPQGWNEAVLQGFGYVRFTLSGNPGAIHGVVKAAGEVVVGASVYLEAYDAASRKRLTDLRSARTDLQGVYRFTGLPPGAYRVLATFEYQMPDVDAMDRAGARPVQIESREDLQTDLDLYILR